LNQGEDAQHFSTSKKISPYELWDLKITVHIIHVQLTVPPKSKIWPTSLQVIPLSAFQDLRILAPFHFSPFT